MSLSVMTVMDGLPGWVVAHWQYGKWFISRDSVIADWKQDHAQAYPGQPVPEPSDDEIQVWFSEQTTWIEVAACGKQLERPDMAAVEIAWLRKMADDSDCVALA